MQKLTSLSPTLQYLEALYPRQANVPVLEAGKTMGYAEQTIRNKIHTKTFPLETFMLGARRMVLKCDLANYLESQKKKRRGPRTKAEQIEAFAQTKGGVNDRI